jgi:hypothetical protein
MKIKNARQSATQKWEIRGQTEILSSLISTLKEIRKANRWWMDIRRRKMYNNTPTSIDVRV